METKVVLRAAHLYRNYDSSQEYPGQLTIRNAYLNIFTKDRSKPSAKLWLGGITSTDFDSLSLHKTLIIWLTSYAGSSEFTYELSFGTAEEAEKLKLAVLAAVNNWRKAFPALSEKMIEQFFQERNIQR